MQEKLLKKLLKKADVVEFTWPSVTINLRCVSYLNDKQDREFEFGYISNTRPDGNHYDLKRHVYLYRKVRGNLIRIAVINDTGITQL